MPATAATAGYDPPVGVLSLVTDFGLGDYYVAAVKGTLLRLAPETAIVDVSHQVPPGDVEEAAFLLGGCWPSFPTGTVHLAVVDPGVGSERRILVARRDEGLFVAPDNGLLTPVLAGARVVAVRRDDLFLPGQGSTFHGRDRFAPVAAFLLRGGAPGELGPEVSDAVRLALPPPSRTAAALEGRIAHVDRFGNLVTDIPSDWLPAGPFRAEVLGHVVARFATYYRELGGEPGLLPGSLGTLELSLDGESLAERWQVGRGAPVRILLER